MKLKPYPKYKPSGVEWLGDVPAHWSIKRLGYYFTERREKVSDRDFAPLSVTKNGVVPQLETAAKTDDGDNRKKVCAGDFVINSRSDRKGSSGAAGMDGSVSLISTVLTPWPEMNIQFAHQLLRSQPFQEEFYRYGKGIVADLWSTNYSEMRNISLAVPGLAEQSHIVAFLDRETAKIDTLITKQEKLIAVLQEKRQAVISHAIRCAGDDPPTKIGYHIDLLPGYAFASSDYSLDEGDIKLLRGANVGVGSIRWADTVYWPKNKLVGLEPYFLQQGDIVFGMDRPWIGDGVRIATIEQEDLPALLLQRVCRLRALPGLLPEYLNLLLRSEEFKHYVAPDLTGVSVPHISPDQILSFRVRLPDQRRQNQIFLRTRTELDRIDTLIAKAQQAIELQKEHRTALISAAVTGKIDVRGLVDADTNEEKAA